jgi:hypothetical protein
VSLGPIALIADTTGGLMAFEPAGQRRWSASLREGAPAGAPLVREDALWILTGDGTIQRRSPSDGKALERFSLGIMPAGGPLGVGPEFAIPVALGTVRLFTPPKRGEPQ